MLFRKLKKKIMLSKFISLLILIKRRAVDLIHNIAEPGGLTEIFFYIKLRKQNEKVKMKTI